MKYCKRCMYPENAKPTIIFDDNGVCSGCRYHESRQNLEVNWDERKEIFEEILQEAKDMAKERGNLYDCIIPVSGGKDSHYQVWLLKEKYGMNPLLVTFNHTFNAPASIKNLDNLVAKSGCDLIRCTPNMKSVKKIAKYMLSNVGDITWHFHAGIRTFPYQVAVEKNIPLIIWGEHGFAELTGVVSLEDFVEFTTWTRREHDMRGLEPKDIVNDSNGEITIQDLIPYIFPSDEKIENTEVRGIYISNFFDWDAKAQTELMIKEWGFNTIAYKRDRTFNLFSKIEDHANDVHDYLKYLKFGYGRATDDASTEVRHGRLTREEAAKLVEEYDSNIPSTLQTYLDFLEITEEEFYNLIEDMRDLNIWEKINDKWVVKDNITNHINPIEDDQYRVPQSIDRVFSNKNKHMYYNDKNKPLLSDDNRLNIQSVRFQII